MIVLDGVDRIPTKEEIQGSIPKKWKLVHVFGSRTFNDRPFIYETLKTIVGEKFFLINGDAYGADKISSLCQVDLLNEARKPGTKQVSDEIIKRCRLLVLPNWDMYPGYAGPKRNKIMVDLSDIGIGFWDLSYGTKPTSVIVDKKFPYTRLDMLKSGTFDTIRRWNESGKKFHIFIKCRNINYIGMTLNINLPSIKTENRRLVRSLV